MIQRIVMVMVLAGVSAAAAACTDDGTTGSATLTVDDTESAMAAIMYPSQTIDPSNDRGVYRGWVVGS